MRAKIIINLLLIFAALVIVIIPGLIFQGRNLTGTDTEAGKIIMETYPGYIPWASNLSNTLSTEKESLLFNIQAAAGAVVVIFVLVYFAVRKYRQKKKTEDSDV